MRINRVKNLILAPNDGEKLYLVVTPLQLGLDKNSNWKGGVNTVTVEVWRQKGKDDPTQSNMGSYTVIVYKNGTSTVKVSKSNTASFTFQASKSDTSYEIVLKVNSKNADSKTVTISADGADGAEGRSIALTLTRNNLYTDAQWASWGAIGHSEPYMKRDGDTDLTTCRVGDYFVVSGTSSDTGSHHTITYKCTAVTANIITGTSISYTKDGDKGTGISSTTWYYLATTMATGVTRSTSGWTTSYQQGTPELPFVWRYGDTLLTNGTHQYTACELIFSYSAGANPNLLEQTNFSSLQALDKWTNRGRLEPLTGVTVDAESYAAVTTGTQAHNAYYDRTTKTTAQILYKEVLEQTLWSTDGTIRKLEASTWYTLSFWAKGDGVQTYVFPEVIDQSSVSYKDGVMLPAGSLGSDASVSWSLNGTWTRHTLTFKTRSSISGEDKRLLFRLLPKSSSSYSNSVYLCMPKLEVGMQATSYISNEESTHFGQVRNRRWAINTQYQAGKVDEQFDDTVLFGETGFFHCIKSHISTLDNAPNGTNGSIYWEATSKVAVLATEIFFAEKALINNLIATLIQTGYSGSPHIEAEGSEFKIFGKGQYPAIYLAVNDDNRAVLRFQDENTGEFLYDLGPDGIMKEFSEVADSYSEVQLHKLTNVKRVSEILDIGDSDCTTYYRFNEGYKKIGSGTSATKEYHVSGTSSPSSNNSAYFTSKNYNGTQIADGWYCKKNNGNYIQKLTDATYVNEDGLTENKRIYQVNIMNFISGKLAQTAQVLFQYTDYQHASKSVGCDENGNELSTSTYTYLYSYWQQNNITL